MNLRDEHYYQKRMDVLDCLQLSEENRKLAEEYLDLANTEREELIKKVQIQDFSRLAKEKQRESIAYVAYLEKRKRTEELEAYVQFLAAVGGSTAVYVLTSYGWEIKRISAFLSREQEIAMKAEGVVWKEYSLNANALEDLFQEAKTNPDAVWKAIPLCVHQSANAKILLSGVLLFVTRPENRTKKEGLLNKIFSANEEEETSSYEQLVKYLEDVLVASIPSLFLAPEPTKEEVEPLVSFVRSQTEERLSGQAAELLARKQFSSYLLTLLSGVAFLAIDHSKQLVNFLRLCLEIRLEVTLSACKDMTPGRRRFADHLDLFTKELSFHCIRYIRWGINRKAAWELQQAADRYPQHYWQVAREIGTRDYDYLLSQARISNPGLAEKIEQAEGGRQEIKLIHELAAVFSTGTKEVTAYLMGEAKLEALYPFINGWRGESVYYRHYDLCSRFKQFTGKNHPQLYARGMILMALAMEVHLLNVHFNLSSSGLNKDKLKTELEELLQIFNEGGLPVVYQADALGAVYDSSYHQMWKSFFMDAVVEALSSRGNIYEQQLQQGAKEATATGRGICLRVLDHFGEGKKEAILAAALDSSKQVKEVLLAICCGHREWEEDMLTLLFSKKSQERELAIRTLKFWGVETYKGSLKTALEKEKSKKMKELLEDCLGETVFGEKKAEVSGQNLAEGLLKGGKARKVAWAFDSPFSLVHTLEGDEVEKKYLQAILVAYADKSVPGVSKEAKVLAGKLKEEELNRFSEELFVKWLETGAEAKKKWVLYAVSCHGGEQIVPVFWRNIQEWAQNSRGALAAEAVRALAFNGNSQALLQVDQIARKFKFRQVKAAAQQALESAAIELGISKQELEDRIVPNLGFNDRMERIFDYGTRSFKVYLTTSLELEILDEGGKQLKNLPVPGKKDEEEKAKAAYEAFKQLKKQLKIVTANQKQRLEYALSTERLWSSECWRELFVRNPLMHQFAIGLIWGIYEEGKRTSSFRYLEDGSFTTCDEEELELPKEAFIGLVHPIELEEQELACWKEQMSDYEITQPIEQLERPVYCVTEEEKEAVELNRFGGKLLNGLSLSGKLQGMGWYKGSVEDAGMYCTFFRKDGEWGVELEFSGCFVGDENEEIIVYGLIFTKAGSKVRRNYASGTIENAYKLGEVHPRYFSEIVLQMTRATASSQEQLPYPECKDNH